MPAVFAGPGVVGVRVESCRSGRPTSAAWKQAASKASTHPVAPSLPRSTGAACECEVVRSRQAMAELGVLPANALVAVARASDGMVVRRASLLVLLQLYY